MDRNTFLNRSLDAASGAHGSSGGSSASGSSSGSSLGGIGTTLSTGTESRIDKVRKLLASPLNRRKSSCAPPPITNKVFGAPLEILAHQHNPIPVFSCNTVDKEPYIPYIISRLCRYIEDSQGLSQEGLFRISGNARLIEKLKTSFDTFGDAPLETEGDIASAAALLKLFLRELPEPIIPPKLHSSFLNAIKDNQQEPSQAKDTLKMLVAALPAENFCVLRYLSDFLSRVAYQEEKNRMTASNLGLVFGPNLFRVCADDYQGLKEQAITNQVVTTFINEFHHIFGDNASPNPSGPYNPGPLSLEIPCDEESPFKDLSTLAITGDESSDSQLKEEERQRCQGLLTTREHLDQSHESQAAPSEGERGGASSQLSGRSSPTPHDPSPKHQSKDIPQLLVDDSVIESQASESPQHELPYSSCAHQSSSTSTNGTRKRKDTQSQPSAPTSYPQSRPTTSTMTTTTMSTRSISNERLNQEPEEPGTSVRALGLKNQNSDIRRCTSSDEIHQMDLSETGHGSQGSGLSASGDSRPRHHSVAHVEPLSMSNFMSTSGSSGTRSPHPPEPKRREMSVVLDYGKHCSASDLSDVHEQRRSGERTAVIRRPNTSRTRRSSSKSVGIIHMQPMVRAWDDDQIMTSHQQHANSEGVEVDDDEVVVDDQQENEQAHQDIGPVYRERCDSMKENAVVMSDSTASRSYHRYQHQARIQPSIAQEPPSTAASENSEDARVARPLIEIVSGDNHNLKGVDKRQTATSHQHPQSSTASSVATATSTSSTYSQQANDLVPPLDLKTLHLTANDIPEPIPAEHRCSWPLIKPQAELLVGDSENRGGEKGEGDEDQGVVEDSPPASYGGTVDTGSSAPIAVQMLRKANSYDAPLSPSAYRSYLRHRGLHLVDPMIPPSPPVEQDELYAMQAKNKDKNSTDSPRLKQIMKRIHSVKKKIKEYELSFETEHGYRPSYEQKVTSPRAKPLMAELNSLRKDLKDYKEEAQLVEAKGRSYKSYAEERLLGKGPSDQFEVSYTDFEQKADDQHRGIGTQTRPSDLHPRLSVSEMLVEMEKQMKAKREHVSRPENLEELTPEQLVEEKLMMQKALLKYESIYGRPETKQDREIMRPIYDRYRAIKRLISKNLASKALQRGSNQADLVPINENEALTFTPGSLSKAGGVEMGPRPIPSAAAIRPSVPSSIPGLRPHPSISSTEPKEPNNNNDQEKDEAVGEGTSADVETQEDEKAGKKKSCNLHELPLHELVKLLNDSRQEKKHLRKVLKNFEESFQKKTGRRVEKEDRVHMEVVYTNYKHMKGRVRLLEALISKHERSP